MRRRRPARVFSLAFSLPALILGLTVASGYDASGGSRHEDERTIDYTVTSDGRHAWAAMRVSDDGETTEMILRLVDLAGERVVEEYAVPTADSFRARLFTQGSAVNLVVPLDEGDDDTWGVYSLTQGEAPELVSDTLRIVSGFSEPVQWQGRLTLVGLNDQGRPTMMVLEDEKLRMVDLEKAYPELGKVKQLDTRTDLNAAMPMYGIDPVKLETPLDTDKPDSYRVGLWLQSSGLPPLAPTESESGLMATLIPLYYTEGKIPAFREGENGAMRLGTLDPADLVDPLAAADRSSKGSEYEANLGRFAFCDLRREITLLEAPPLYNTNLHYLDRTTALAVGTKTAGPASDLLVFLYDGTSGSLTPLPADLFGSVFADPDSTRILIWKTGDVLFAKDMSEAGEGTGAVVNLAAGTATAISGPLFEYIVPPAPSSPTAPSSTPAPAADSTPGTARVLGLVAGLVALIVATAVVAGVVIRRRRAAAAARAPYPRAPGLGDGGVGAVMDAPTDDEPPPW